MAAVNRSWTGAFFDMLIGRAAGLPPESCPYAIRPVKIPLSDGVELAADLYRPAIPALGTILVRTPYGRGFGIAIGNARPYAARGYQVLLVSCRGTFGSGGDFDPARNEIDDGRDVIVWMRQQTWYTGTFATLGASYMGFTQWAVLTDPQPDHVAAVIVVGLHDYWANTWGTGALNLDILRWCGIVSMQEESSWIPGPLRMLAGQNRLRTVANALPLLDGADEYFGRTALWEHMRERTAHPDPEDAYWATARLHAALERAEIPILLVAGWQDVFLNQTMEQYATLSKRGCNVGLITGPWDHMQSAQNAPKPTFEWLAVHFGQKKEDTSKLPVRAFITGAQEWRDLPSWPPPTEMLKLSLQPDGGLAIGESKLEPADMNFIFDPADPTPTLGGALLLGGGVVDDSLLASRQDVLAFASAPLEQDVDVMGCPLLELSHSSDNRHADIFFRLSEVNRSGRSYNVTEEYRRLEPTRPTEPSLLQLQMRPCAHRFSKGNQIRLLLAGGWHPRYMRNLGTNSDHHRTSEMNPTMHTIHLGQSLLFLPVATSASNQ